MAAYIFRRMLLFIPTLFGVTVLIFFLMRVVPGDTIDALVSDSPQFSAEERAFLRKKLGLDRPLPEQFYTWIKGLPRADFGESLVQERPVGNILKERFPPTLELSILAASFALVLGVSVGTISGMKRNSLMDYVVRVVSIGGLSMPTFFTGVMVLFLLLHFFSWSPPLGYKSVWSNPGANLSHQIWPALVLGYFLAAPIARMTRSQILEVLGEDYIRTARAKGLPDSAVMLRHALRNALLPVITLAGLLVGGLLSGVVVAEAIFGIPGMGTGLLQSVSQRDYPTTQAFVFVIALMYMTINLVIDVLYGVIDPRIRLSRRRAA